MKKESPACMFIEKVCKMLGIAALLSYYSRNMLLLAEIWSTLESETGQLSSTRSSIITCSAFAVQETLEKTRESLTTNTAKEMMPKIDKSGRFCSPRAARELALLIVYAACLEGSDPIRLFERRVNSRREPGYEFNKASLLEYNHMSFGGPPVTTGSAEEADELMRNDEEESAIEAEVLSAPPKLVYSKLLLRFTRKLLVAVVDKWDNHVCIIDKVIPPNWKDQPAGRILELSILHLAMSEITVLGTRHQIVINEAVDLAKRFCDGAAPRIINGCLRTFVRDLEGTARTEAKQEVSSEEKLPLKALRLSVHLVRRAIGY
ncbi:N utilization substance B [Melia azedarach]|uniref:N utilization substance B n=1 Tax=Melia azedarach TaxID=155640 RepID=A0ACC1YLT2_MELAZ|nr:N utilization substance B [Melia azedarach]